MFMFFMRMFPLMRMFSPLVILRTFRFKILSANAFIHWHLSIHLGESKKIFEAKFLLKLKWVFCILPILIGLLPTEYKRFHHPRFATQLFVSSSCQRKLKDRCFMWMKQPILSKMWLPSLAITRKCRDRPYHTSQTYYPPLRFIKLHTSACVWNLVFFLLSF